MEKVYVHRDYEMHNGHSLRDIIQFKKLDDCYSSRRQLFTNKDSKPIKFTKVLQGSKSV